MLLRLAFWGLNIYGIKKTFDLAKENTQLKEELKDSETTIKTLLRKFSDDVPNLFDNDHHFCSHQEEEEHDLYL